MSSQLTMVEELGFKSLPGHVRKLLAIWRIYVIILFDTLYRVVLLVHVTNLGIFVIIFQGNL